MLFITCRNTDSKPQTLTFIYHSPGIGNNTGELVHQSLDGCPTLGEKVDLLSRTNST